jgi:exosortase/archaeosortase family protein
LLVNGARIATSALLIDRFGPEAGGGLSHELLGQALLLGGAALLAALVLRFTRDPDGAPARR